MNPTPTTDRFTIRAVVLGLIGITIGGIGALTFCIAAVSLTPEQRGTLIGSIGTMASLALGGLVGLLASTRSNDPAPAPAPVPGPLPPAVGVLAQVAIPAEQVGG